MVEKDRFSGIRAFDRPKVTMLFQNLLLIQHLGFYIDGSGNVLFTARTCVGEIPCENGGEERFCSQRGVYVGV
jgi:hypothetical protein